MPSTNAENVQLAASLASKATDLPPFEIKYRKLENEWTRNFGYLERIQTRTQNSQKKTDLNL